MSEETKELPPHDRLNADVRRLTHLIADDGKKIAFGSTMKIVYAYLVTFQGNPKRLNWPDPIHPNMDLIAWECGVTKPTAQKAINDLVAAGVVEKKQIQVRSGFKSNAYFILQQADVFKRGVTPPKPLKGKQKPDETPNEQPAMQIFDDRGVVTEAFINSLKDGDAPNRNEDGTLESFRYVYWAARHTQDKKDGIPVRTREEYMGEAQPWHVPPHLLSKVTAEPAHDEEPNEDANF